MFDFITGPYRYIAIAAIVALDLLLMIWGASLLYRGLDGDRITLKRRIKGRWTNSINFALIFAGLFVLLVGAGLGWLLAMEATGGPSSVNALRSFVSVLVLTASIVMFCWAWAGRRAAGKPRCPQCLYDVSAVPGMICPECGYEAETSGHWHKPRKRKRWIIASLLVFAIGMIGMQENLIKQNWRRALPTNFLIDGIGSLPESMLGLPQYDSIFWYGRGTSAETFPWGLYDRIEKGLLSSDQRGRLTRVVEKAIVNARTPDELHDWLLVSRYTKDFGLELFFTPEEAQAFIQSALLKDPAQPHFSVETPPKIDWQGLNVLDDATRTDLAIKLVQASYTNSDTLLNYQRRMAAFSMDPKSETLADEILRPWTDESLQITTENEWWIAIQTTIFILEQNPILYFRKIWEACLNAPTVPMARKSLALLSASINIYSNWVRPDEATRQTVLGPLVQNESERQQIIDLIGLVLADTVSSYELAQAASSSDLWATNNILSWLLTKEDLDLMLDNISNSTFTPGELTILLYRNMESPVQIPLDRLIALSTHESAQVRQMVALSLFSLHHFERVDLDPYRDAIINMRDYPGRQKLLESLAWDYLDEPWNRPPKVHAEPSSNSSD